jgi:hypothetical protein
MAVFSRGETAGVVLTLHPIAQPMCSAVMEV